MCDVTDGAGVVQSPQACLSVQLSIRNGALAGGHPDGH